MDDTRSDYVTDATQVGTMVKKRIDQSSRVVAGCRVHDHMGRLDDDQQVFIFIKDVQRDVFGLGLGGLRRGNLDLDCLSSMEVSRGTHRPPAYKDESLFTPTLGLRPARSLDVVRDRSIDSDVFFLRLHDPAHEPVWRTGLGFWLKVQGSFVRALDAQAALVRGRRRRNE